MELRTLTTDNVLFIHDTLVQDFAESNDPISPSGVRSLSLLQSAVGRQHTGMGSVLKYPGPIENAATFLYGLCNDHPFHNGNKRTALVATLVHLDKNKRTVFGTSQAELYDLMLKVASHAMLPQRRSRRSKRPLAPNSDDEVRAISKWLEARVDTIKRGERQITYRELRRILQSFGYFLENPNSNKIEVVTYVTEQRGLIVRREVRVRKRLGVIGWPGDNRDIAISDIKRVREMCSLREEDGVDSDCFYSEAAMVDTFVNRYRTLLRKLALV